MRRHPAGGRGARRRDGAGEGSPARPSARDRLLPGARTGADRCASGARGNPHHRSLAPRARPRKAGGGGAGARRARALSDGVSDALLAHEPVVRFAAFAAVLGLMLLAESLAPARARNFHRWKRWPANLAMTVLSTALLRFLFPLLAVGAAIWAQGHGIGLFRWLALPYGLAFLASLLLLDVLIYGQHWAMHQVPLLWRFHRVHHTDRDV